MTHEQFIEFQTAQLAKKAGFDWECRCYYTELIYTNSMKLTCDDSHPKQNWNEKRLESMHRLSAPTQAELQRWLREQKDLIIEIILSTKHIGQIITHTYGYFYVISNGQKYITPFNNYLPKFPTYEDALEKGLQEGLKYLITHKNG